MILKKILTGFSTQSSPETKDQQLNPSPDRMLNSNQTCTLKACSDSHPLAELFPCPAKNFFWRYILKLSGQRMNLIDSQQIGFGHCLYSLGINRVFANSLFS